jgi:hypothetical protein
MDEEENIIDPFSTADEISDVIFIVEEKRIFAHKSILGKKNFFSRIQLNICFCFSCSESFSCI